MLSIGWGQALAWRMGRLLLDPIGTEPVDVAAAGAQRSAAAEIRKTPWRCRGRAARPNGRIIKTFAGDDDGGRAEPRAAGSGPHVNGRASARERNGLEPSQLGPRCGGRARRSRTGRAGPALRGPRYPSGRRAAPLRRLDQNQRAGVPDLDEAGPRAVEAYFRSYGPATPGHAHYWLGEGLGAGRRRIEAWIGGLGGRLAEVDVGGDPRLIMREDLEALAATQPTTAVRLLPGYDQWVLGPGTADEHIVPPARRALVSRQANLVVEGGVVSGTWALREDRVSIGWFSEAGSPPTEALRDEVGRLGTMLERHLQSAIEAT